jgi:hypothetical protein
VNLCISGLFYLLFRNFKSFRCRCAPRKNQSIGAIESSAVLSYVLKWEVCLLNGDREYLQRAVHIRGGGILGQKEAYKRVSSRLRLLNL